MYREVPLGRCALSGYGYARDSCLSMNMCREPESNRHVAFATQDFKKSGQSDLQSKSIGYRARFEVGILWEKESFPSHLKNVGTMFTCFEVVLTSLR